MLLEFIFWLSVVLLFYIYFGYPLALAALARINPKSLRKDPGFQPQVTILIAAYNEAKDIEATLRNKLAQTYPADKLQILVVSDESDDGTDDIVRSIASESTVDIQLVRQSPRQGKTAGLNLLVPMARGEILLFSDANSQWGPNTVEQLTANFADPAVGYVTGKMVYVNPDGSMIGDGCSAYMKYENWMRAKETLLGSVVGVDGGVDAMRRSLHSRLRADQLPDFVQPLMVTEQGYRVVYEPEALLKEDALSDSSSEYSMRVRVSLRALWALKDMRALLNPARHGVFAWQLWSHKVLRYYAFVPLATATITALALVTTSWLYLFATIGLVALYGLAAEGYRRQKSDKYLPTFLAIPCYFMLLNITSAHAALSFARGERKVIWNPRKG